MGDWRFMYRCRLCGEAFGGARTSNKQLAGAAHLHLVLGGDSFVGGGIPVGSITAHYKCPAANGGDGLGDYAGFRDVEHSHD